jgi:hypothetical protein
VPIESYITDPRFGDAAHVHRFDGISNDHKGLLVQTDRFIKPNPGFLPLLNDTFGIAMNQNIAFGGTPEIIHNGGSSVEWTGAAGAGSWNFADSGVVTLTAGENGDNAIFTEETPTTVAMSGFTTLTGKITLTTFNDTNHTFTVIFDLAGAPAGNSVNIDDYIDIGLLGTEQSFAIPKADLGLSNQLVDGFTILLIRIGGSKATVSFDDIQLEATGEPAVFVAKPPLGTQYHMSAFRMTIVDALSVTLLNNSMPNLSYNKILGLTALANGINIKRIQKNVVNFSATFRTIQDMMFGGLSIVDMVSDDTNTMVVLEVALPEPIILNGDDEDFFSVTITDNLAGLVSLTAAARGALES